MLKRTMKDRHFYILEKPQRQYMKSEAKRLERLRPGICWMCGSMMSIISMMWSWLRRFVGWEFLLWSRKTHEIRTQRLYQEIPQIHIRDEDWMSCSFNRSEGSKSLWKPFLTHMPRIMFNHQRLTTTWICLRWIFAFAIRFTFSKHIQHQIANSYDQYFL